MERYSNFIAGEWRQAKSGQVFEDRNPANFRQSIRLTNRKGAYSKAARGPSHLLT